MRTNKTLENDVGGPYKSFVDSPLEIIVQCQDLSRIPGIH